MNYPPFYYDASRPIDLICMGRVAVDLYAEQIGVNLSDASSFKKYLGGCAGNIAVGAARLGLNSMMFSCVGSDEMGLFLKKELQREGVAIDLLYESEKHLTGLVLLGIKPPHEFPLMFYRKDCADMQLKAHHIDASILKQSKALLITGTGLSSESMQETTFAAVQQARNQEVSIILDLDYRPVLWGLTSVGDGETRFRESESVSSQYQKIIPLCDLLVGTEEEICIAGGSNDVDKAILQLRRLTQAPIVIKSGDKGSRVCFAQHEKMLQTKPFPIEVLNVLGAGDAFMAGLLSGLLKGNSWQHATTRANASGALVVTRHGCAPAIPYADELEYFIKHYDTNPLIWKSPILMHLHEEKIKNPSIKALVHNPLGFNTGLNTVVSINETSMNTGINFHVLKLEQGQSYSFNSQFEFAALLMTGRVEFQYGSKQTQVERTDYFSQAPIVLHCPSGSNAAVHALTVCELLLMETENALQFEPILFDESNSLELDNRGKDLLEDTSYRIVRTVFDKRNRPESSLVVGEIITFQGRWSSYPPHYHEQPEIYHYRFSEPQGFAFGEQGKNVLRIRHYDTYQIMNGQEHAHCTAPGYALYTLWVIRHLNNNPYIQPTFAQEHEWTRDPGSNSRMWRQPIE